MSIFDGVDFKGAGGAVKDIFGAFGQGDVAKGYKTQAQGYERAAEIGGINRQLAQQAAGIQQVQSDRDIYHSLGSQTAAIGANGLSLSGSALDVVRDSAREASLTKSLLSRNGQIEDNAYQQEQQSFLTQASAANSSASSAKKSKIGGLISGGLDLATSLIPGGGLVSGLIKGVGKLFSDDSLKEDISLVSRRKDGIGVYTFRYKGQETLFTGVLASEVERLYPDAVSVDDDGYKLVDYDMIGINPGTV